LDGGDLLVTPEGARIHVDTENIREHVPFGSRIKAVAEFAYLWVLGSSQEAFPVWTFVQGRISSTAQVSKFDINAVRDDEEESNVATSANSATPGNYAGYGGYGNIEKSHDDSHHVHQGEQVDEEDAYVDQATA
jgi:hypothetical protein